MSLNNPIVYERWKDKVDCPSPGGGVDGVVDGGVDSGVVEVSVADEGAGSGGLGAAVGHLRAETRAWVEGLYAEFKFGSHQVNILIMAGETWDRYLEAREVLAAKGLTYEDRFDSGRVVPRARPEVAIERDCRIAYARLVRELGLDVEGPDGEKMIWDS